MKCRIDRDTNACFDFLRYATFSVLTLLSLSVYCFVIVVMFFENALLDLFVIEV